MSARFETNYRIKTGEDLGNPDTWNRRLQDIDRRISGNEDALDDVGVVADRIEAVALQRLDNVITPLVVETRERVAQIPSLFAAKSSTTNTINEGYQLFVIEDGSRTTFAHQGYVGIYYGTAFDNGMLGRVESYDRTTGEMVVTVEVAWGTGTYSQWTIEASQPYGVHASRTDNPHDVTAAQVGAYTVAQTNDAIAASKSSLIGSASSGYDTLGKVETVVKANANSALDAAVAMAIALG